MASQEKNASAQDNEKIPLKEKIARLAYIISLETNRSSVTGDKLIRVSIAVGLLNQAGLIVDTNEQLALRLFNQARSSARKG